MNSRKCTYHHRHDHMSFWNCKNVFWSFRNRFLKLKSSRNPSYGIPTIFPLRYLFSTDLHWLRMYIFIKIEVQYVTLCHHKKQQWWYALTAYLLFQIHNFCQFFFSLSPSFMRKTAKSIVWTITHRNHVEVSDVWCENLKVMFNLRYIIIFFFQWND